MVVYGRGKCGSKEVRKRLNLQLSFNKGRYLSLYVSIYAANLTDIKRGILQTFCCAANAIGNPACVNCMQRGDVSGSDRTGLAGGSAGRVEEGGIYQGRRPGEFFAKGRTSSQPDVSDSCVGRLVTVVFLERAFY